MRYDLNGLTMDTYNFTAKQTQELDFVPECNLIDKTYNCSQQILISHDCIEGRLESCSFREEFSDTNWLELEIQHNAGEKSSKAVVKKPDLKVDMGCSKLVLIDKNVTKVSLSRYVISC